MNGLFALNDALQIKKLSGTDESSQSNVWPGVRECLHLDIPELILRSVRIAMMLLDKHGKGFLVFGDIEEAQKICDLLENIPLTVHDQYLYMIAPVDIGKTDVLYWHRQFARQLSEKKQVELNINI